MNQIQRKYLIDKIQANTQEAIKQLEASMPKQPDINNYCLQGLLNGTLKLRSEKDIMHLLRCRALEGGNKSVFTDGYGLGYRNSNEVKFKMDEIFILPEDYLKVHREWKEQSRKIRDQINTLKQQSEGLCTRIQLSSNKTLEKMIAEVDNMGDITFMDCTLKSLMTKGEHNLID